MSRTNSNRVRRRIVALECTPLTATLAPLAQDMIYELIFLRFKDEVRDGVQLLVGWWAFEWESCEDEWIKFDWTKRFDHFIANPLKRHYPNRWATTSSPLTIDLMPIWSQECVLSSCIHSSLKRSFGLRQKTTKTTVILRDFPGLNLVHKWWCTEYCVEWWFGG